ncbi:hypothetical protein E6H12_05140 [Candidatus Bathyarchaeota archaeon]|nr:MAG: hypothetical protein E6H12_05140 [Candidatus Bathyarchaeota archaeon]
MAVLGPRAGTAALLILVLFAGLPFVRPAQAERVLGLTWDRTYLQIDPAGGSSVEQTSDGGFIMTALSRGQWVMKANAAGIPQWQREYSAGGSGVVTQTGDGGFVLASGDQLLKLSNRGGVEWSRLYGAPYDALFTVHQTSDGGYVAMGNTQSIESGHVFNAWILKLDSLGGIVWQKAFPGQDGYWVEQTSDGGYIMSGTVLADGVGAAWVAKLDAYGSISWQKAFEVSWHSPAYQVHQTLDGGYVVLAQIDNRVGQILFASSEAWILRLDSEGRLLWQKSFGAEGFAYPSSISQISDGGFVLAGRSNPASLNPLIGIWGPWLLKLDSSGNLVWQKMYGLGNSGLQEVHETMDGGLIAVGNEATDCCGHLVWAMKLDSDGNVHGCDVGFASNATLTDTSATVTTPSATSVDTPFTPSPTDVTVARLMIMPQDQCRPKIDTV